MGFPSSASLVFAALVACTFADVADATNSTDVEEIVVPYCPISGVYFSFMGAALSLIFSNMGAAYGTWKSAKGMFKLSMMRMAGQDQVVRAMLPVIMAGVSGIYGLIIAVIIANGVMGEGEHSIYNGYGHFNAGIVCGLSNLASGLAVGLSGEPGVVASARQPKLYVGMVLVWSFASALGLYGLIVGLIMCSVDGNHLCEKSS